MYVMQNLSVAVDISLGMFSSAINQYREAE